MPKNQNIIMEAETIATQRIAISLVKTDPEKIRKLFERLSAMPCGECVNPYTSEDQVKDLMRYNIWTIDQFCDVSGLNVSTVTNMTRPSVIDGQIGTKLDICFPLKDSGGRGPKCILRNPKSERYIKLA